MATNHLYIHQPNYSHALFLDLAIAFGSVSHECLWKSFGFCQHTEYNQKSG